MVVIAQLAVVHEKHDAHRSELLGKGCKTEVSLRVDGMKRTKIRDTVTLAKDWLAVAHNEDCAAGCVAGLERSEDGIDLGRRNLSSRRNG